MTSPQKRQRFFSIRFIRKRSELITPRIGQVRRELVKELFASSRPTTAAGLRSCSRCHGNQWRGPNVYVINSARETDEPGGRKLRMSNRLLYLRRCSDGCWESSDDKVGWQVLTATDAREALAIASAMAEDGLVATIGPDFAGPVPLNGELDARTLRAT